MPSDKALSKNVVGPKNSTKTSNRMAAPRLISLSRFTPLFTPATADAMAKPLTSTIIIHWNKKLDSLSTPKCTSPALSCTTPKPIDVEMPKNVLTSAKTSTTSPNLP